MERERWVCPKCQGLEQRDLSGLRRKTGLGLVLTGFVILGAITALGVEAPGWSLGIVVVLVLLGIVAVLGANRARYCARCDVRMQRQDR